MICKLCNIEESRSKKSHYCENCFVEVRKETQKREMNIAEVQYEI